MSSRVSDGTVSEELLQEVIWRVRSPRSVHRHLRWLARSEFPLALMLRGSLGRLTLRFRRDGAPPDLVDVLQGQLRLLSVRMLAALRRGDARSRRPEASGPAGHP